MPPHAFRVLVAALLLAPLLPQGASHAAVDSLTISLNLFSGRPRPRAILSESSLANPVAAALESRLSNPMPYSMLPTMPSTPGYTGMLLRRNPAGSQTPTYVVRAGWISTKETEPCYRDSGNVLELLGVSAAFTQDDLDAPGGPKPMVYLACMVPDSLHPNVTCASTGLRPPSPRASFADPAFLPLPRFDAAGRKRTLSRDPMPFLFDRKNR
jgi:hypothetical protein